MSPPLMQIRGIPAVYRRPLTRDLDVSIVISLASPFYRSPSTCVPANHQFPLGSGICLNCSSSDYEDVDAMAPRFLQTHEGRTRVC
jgi:hypothetical protein